MARRTDVRTLAQIQTVRAVMILKAEAAMTRAAAEARDAGKAREAADEALGEAEAEWRDGIRAPGYPPEWLRALATAVVDRDRAANEADTQLCHALEERRTHDAAFCLADANERIAKRALTRARATEIDRRDERRRTDRPVGAPTR